MHRLVAIVGIDGSGKTTLAKTLVAQLRSEGRRVRSFENAGGRPPLNWLARRLGHDDAQKWLGTARLEAIEQRFRHVPMRLAATWARLPGERIAILDRWTVCQYAAMRARGSEDASARRRYRRLPWPDHVLFLDVSPEQAHARLRQRGTDVDELDWLHAAYAAYRSLPEWDALTVIDGAGSPADVVARARACTEI